jgi:hypothetical protein
MNKFAFARRCFFAGSVGLYFNKAASDFTQLDTQKWDANWDGLEKGGSKCYRTIVLIRHGQYVPKDSDEDRILTALGRQQAVETGKRLQTLLADNFLPPIDTVYYSTMTRATETHDLIVQQLSSNHRAPSVPCDLIREGAVFRPEPPHSSWKPSDESFEADGQR